MPASLAPLTRPGIRVAVITALILLIPLVANQFTTGEGWRVGDFVLAAALLLASGMLVELALVSERSLVYRAIAAVIGFFAIAAGSADDAPGLVLFGLVLLGTLLVLTATTALAHRRPRV